jgi:hypothetical protein
MTVWLAIVIIFGVGLVGGLANALMADKGFRLPKREGDLWIPGFLGSMFVSAITAVVLWGLYSVIGQEPVTGEYTLTLSEVMGGLVSGVGGARLLTAEVDKRVLRQAAVSAAEVVADSDLVRTIETSAPVDALQAAKAAKQTP